MNRELQFRAWDDQLKVMLDGDAIEESETIKTYLSYGKLIVGRFPANADYYELLPMQFTGLLDKNGKEIYEGDIVSCVEGAYTTGGNVKITYAVSFHTGTFRLEYNGMTFRWLHDAFGVAEVIGNIHDNPELLK